MQHDRTRTAVSRQLKGMGASMSVVPIFPPSPRVSAP